MPDKNLELEELIAAWIDGRLDAEGSQVLQQTLLASAAARSLFRKYGELDAALHDIADTSGMFGPVKLSGSSIHTTMREQTSGYGRRSSTGHLEGAKPEHFQFAVQPTTAGRNRLALLGHMAVWWGATAVGLLLAIALYDYIQREDRNATPLARIKVDEPAVSDQSNLELLRKPPAPVATLSFAKDVVWSESQLKMGQAILEGETIGLKRGRARISVGYGAEIVAEGPCSLSFLSSDRVRLHQGAVAIDVAPWAKGFTVVTDDMTVVDLGTTFTVSAVPGKTSEAAVLKGVVRVNSSNVENRRPRGLLITEGQRVSIDRSGSFDDIEVEDVGERLSTLDFGALRPYRPVALHNTGFELSVGDEDLHWRVISGPEGFDGPQFASVCPPERGYLPNVPSASQWISVADWKIASPNSIYTFQTEFNLNGYDLGTMQLFGRFLADNGVASVRVNGHPVQVKSWVDNVKYQPFGDLQFRFVNITEGLVAGKNVIEIDVLNGMMRNDKVEDPPMKAIPNPMALRVEWYAFGRQQVVEDGEDSAMLLRKADEGYHSTPLLSRNLR